MVDHTHQKILVSICSKLSCLSACKKSTTSLTSFLTCCRERKLVILSMPGHTSKMKKTSTFVSRQKINFMFSLRYCKDIVNFGYFGPVWLITPKVILYWYTMVLVYHIIENFCVYLQAKTQLHPPPHCLMEILQRYANLGTLGIPGYTHQNDCIQCLSACKK